MCTEYGVQSREQSTLPTVDSCQRLPGGAPETEQTTQPEFFVSYGVREVLISYYYLKGLMHLIFVITSLLLDMNLAMKSAIMDILSLSRCANCLNLKLGYERAARDSLTRGKPEQEKGNCYYVALPECNIDQRGQERIEKQLRIRNRQEMNHEWHKFCTS